MMRAIDPQISMARFRARALPTVQFQAIILYELPNDERRLRGMIFTRKSLRCGRLLLGTLVDIAVLRMMTGRRRDIGNVRLSIF